MQRPRGKSQKNQAGCGATGDEVTGPGGTEFFPRAQEATRKLSREGQTRESQEVWTHMSILHPEPQSCWLLHTHPYASNARRPREPVFSFQPFLALFATLTIRSWVTSVPLGQGAGGRERERTLKARSSKALYLRQPISCLHVFSTGVSFTRAFP